MSVRYHQFSFRKNPNLHKQEDRDPITSITLNEMQIKRFSKLEEITEMHESVTYYWPKVRIFGALDAFIMDGENHECYGLQMTINK